MADVLISNTTFQVVGTCILVLANYNGCADWMSHFNFVPVFPFNDFKSRGD